MLDEPDTSTDSRDPDLPTPPRGRRAASRPAGPPKPVTPEPVTPEPEEPRAANTGPEHTGPEHTGPENTGPEKTGPGGPESADLEPVGPEQNAANPSDEGPTPLSVDADASRSVDADAPEDLFEAELRARLQAQLGAGLAEREAADAADSERATDVEKAEIEGVLGMDSPDVEEPPARRQPARRRAAGVDDGDTPRRRSRRRASADSDTSTREETEEAPAETGADRAADVTDADAEDVEAPVEEVSDDDSDDASEADDDSDGDDSDDEDSDADASGDDQSTGTRRRRRRRGGRRRRRSSGDSGDADDSAESSDSDDDSEADESDEQADDNADTDADNNGDDDGDESSSTGRRRRRRRRRRGEDTGGDDDPDTDVVVKVREPRRNKAADEVTGIEGSTRMEAKRQRRREGRAAGRRRTPILSEAEFLARRESVQRTMVIRQNEELAQIAVLEDNVLVEHYVDRASATSLIGNVYLGRVQNVLPSMEAAFIDIGRGRNAVLYAGEVDWDSFGAEGQQRKVENVLKSGQTILVQVTKDPVGAKGARLTNNISLPGRYIVYSPGGHLSGISRKLPDTERKRLKGILSDLVGEDSSVIVRTAAEGASEDELVRDVNRLKAQWEAIEKKVKGGVAPAQLYAEPDATVRIVRDLFTEDFGKLIIHGNGEANDAYDMITAYVSHVAPHLAERIERWDEERGDVFAAHRIDEQIAKALERKVYLPSGGSLVIDRTEAMTVIDVNTGKFTGSGGNLEATVTSNNLEAAEEVVRQLRLRDIGGIIVIDFIDMVLPSNRELLLRRLVECLGRDRTRHQVAEVTSLGLVQMTRKKIGTGLAEAFTVPCEVCKGRGFEIHDMPVESQSQADGGERRGRRGRGRGSNSGSDSSAALPQKATPASSAEAIPDASGDSDRTEPDAVDAPASGAGQSASSGRSRRRGRGRSNDRQEPAVEVPPTPAPEEPSSVEPQVDEPQVDDPREESPREESPTESPAAEPTTDEPQNHESSTQEAGMPSPAVDGEQPTLAHVVEPTPADSPQADVSEADGEPATEEPPA